MIKPDRFAIGLFCIHRRVFGRSSNHSFHSALLRMSSVEDQGFEFYVVGSSSEVQRRVSCGYLIEDSWNDWFKYYTQYYLHIYDQDGARYDIGSVKFGQFSMTENQGRPSLPKWFTALSEDFFSLGQSEEYYESLASLSAPLTRLITSSLRDVVADRSLWERARHTMVMDVSLLRSVSAKTLNGQYRRLLEGGARSTRFSFSFDPPPRLKTRSLEFEVEPESVPPTNVHVLIGRNGVGKTYLLSLMTKALLAEKRAAAQSGKFRWEQDDDLRTPFASLVTVSFSAFDDTELYENQTSSLSGTKYFYVGLRWNSEKDWGKPKSSSALSQEFVLSVQACLQQPRLKRWLKAIDLLTADPVFKEADVLQLAGMPVGPDLPELARRIFNTLSSGHKIVLLTITRLIELVEEKTLVLIDEPEAHLHPPLLSAFVRSLSDLLVNRNGVALIATHSPVVLQEVPRTCVWTLRRSGEEATAERPEVETFGESVGTLTREVFRLEVTNTGFHRLLTEAVAEGGTFEEINQRFKKEIGSEARALLQALITSRHPNNAE